METRPYVAHKTHGNGQLRSLEDRMTSKQFERRSAKMATRAHATGSRGVQMASAALSVLTRGFFGRLKWLVLGR